MKTLKRNKKYKAVSASQTINNIRNILFENDITTIEIHHDSDVDELKSCSVAFFNEGLEFLGINTNGKGMNFEYSLASAYAEFMERLQNDLLFKSDAIRYPNYLNIELFNDNPELKATIIEEGLITDFINSPDEVLLTKPEIIEKYGKHLKCIFHIDDDATLLKLIDDTKIFDFQKKILCLPYYNVTKGEIELVPADFVRVLCGSNGMCAGNNIKEAFVQGLCEIFERYAMRKIYMEEIDLPEIPKEYFVGEKIYDILTELEKKKNYSVSIKDASCGLGLPVIGLLIIDKANLRYTFHLGSDPSPITSLERCLTEINQGTKNSFFAKMQDIHKTWNYFDTDHEFSKEDRLRFELFRTMKNGSGIWPNHIFNNTGVFNGFDKVESNSDDEDIKYLTAIVEKLNTEIFVRDVSTLGFPSLNIYIPGMSEMHPNCFEELKIQARFGIDHKVMFKLPIANEEEIKSLANTFKEKYLNNPQNKPEVSSYYSYIKDESIKTLSFELFLSMLFIRIRDFNNAYYFVNKHIEEESKYLKKKDLYIHCVKDYVRFKSESINDDEIQSKLNQIHHIGIVKEVFDDLKDPEKIFQYHNFPIGFTSSNSDDNSDSYLKVIRVLSKLKHRKKTADINQSDLAIINN